MDARQQQDEIDELSPAGRLCRHQGEWLAAAIAEGIGRRDIDEAHRELFKLHQPWFGNPMSGCRVCDNGDRIAGTATWPCLTLHIVATAYRARPGWDELWRLIRTTAPEGPRERSGPGRFGLGPPD